MRGENLSGFNYMLFSNPGLNNKDGLIDQGQCKSVATIFKYLGRAAQNWKN